MRQEPTGPSDADDSAPDRDDWDRHWDEYAGSAAANPAQEFRRRLILRLLSSEVPPRHILDIGSGTGDLAAALRQVYPDVDLLGLELSRAGIELSRLKVADAVFVQRDLTVDAPPRRRCTSSRSACSCSSPEARERPMSCSTISDAARSRGTRQ